ncbi:rod shape-determining protein MreC [Candidatus Dependentiae bacterium]|nr:rod shape-determining protein MreC [Candidatus Dependentiae bacterium]
MSFRGRLMLLFLGGCILFFLTRVIMPINSWQVMDSVSSVLVYPFLKIQSLIVAPFRSLSQKRWAIHELHTQVDELQQERETLISKLVQLEGALRFANDTKPLAEFMEQYAMQDAQVAHVIMSHISDQEHYVLVDAGSVKGIKPGMVALYQNNLVGRVDTVTPFYSKIVLVTDRSCKVAVWCGAAQARGIHEGINKLDVSILTHMNHLNAVAKDDLVLSSGEGVVFPQGFALGKVAHCSSDGVYQKVMVEPLISFEKLTYCLLIQKGAL